MELRQHIRLEIEQVQLRASSQSRHLAWTFRAFLMTFACLMSAPVNRAQENRAASERIGENEARARVGTAETETLVRVELRGRKNWRGIKAGTVLEGCLTLPISNLLGTRPGDSSRRDRMPA